MTRGDLLKLWNMEDVPLSDEGLELAKDFLVSCGMAVDRINMGDSLLDRREFDLRFNTLVQHANSCRDCNEI